MVMRRARRARKLARSTFERVASRGIRALPIGERAERFLLERTWSGRSADMLDSYLVSGYQNPRINVQSILVRHFLITKLFGSDLDPLMDEELRFAVELNDAIRRRARELGVKMGSYLNPAKHAAVQRVDEVIADRQMEFMDRWREALAPRSAQQLGVLEFACGSANDYRTFVECGLAVHLDYRGVDLTPKNIENARRRCPDAQFEVGDIRNLPYADASCDYVMTADIFEHLSLEAMQHALDEATRLARRGLILTFFNMSDAPEHDVQPKHAYHWNRLSRPQVEEQLRRSFSDLTVVPIKAWLKDRCGYAHSYNSHAYSIFAER